MKLIVVPHGSELSDDCGLEFYRSLFPGTSLVRDSLCRCKHMQHCEKRMWAAMGDFWNALIILEDKDGYGL